MLELLYTCFDRKQVLRDTKFMAFFRKKQIINFEFRIIKLHLILVFLVTISSLLFTISS